MNKHFTLSDLQKSAAGSLDSNAHIFKEPVKNKQKPLPKISVEKVFMQMELEKFCSEHGFTLETEYRFNPERKFRSDWYIIELNCLIEYEGIFSNKSRHTSVTGYSNDAGKYNSCQSLGFNLLRFTALTYTTLITELQKFLK